MRVPDATVELISLTDDDDVAGHAIDALAKRGRSFATHLGSH